jgi:hypothetical protein
MTTETSEAVMRILQKAVEEMRTTGAQDVDIVRVLLVAAHACGGPLLDVVGPNDDTEWSDDDDLIHH